MRMRTTVTPLLVAVALCFSMIIASPTPARCGGFTFGVKPGLMIQAASFGLDSGPLTVLAGMDYVSLQVRATERNESDEVFVSVSMYVPYLGARYYLNRDRSAGSVVPFLEGGVLFPFGNIDMDDQTEYEDVEVSEVSAWGFTAMFGAEYYLAERFSLGGVYGVRYLKNSVGIDAKEDEDIDRVDTEIIYRSTYSALSLNFHF